MWSVGSWGACNVPCAARAQFMRVQGSENNSSLVSFVGHDTHIAGGNSTFEGFSQPILGRRSRNVTCVDAFTLEKVF